MLGKRRLLDWHYAPPEKPEAPKGTALWQEQNDEYEAISWTDSLCKTITKVPVVLGMLDSNRRLFNVPISFVKEDSQERFAYYDIRADEIIVNAAAIKKFSSLGPAQFSDLQLNCIFSIVHELRHAHQYSYPCDPWLKTFTSENPQLVSVYDTLVREAVATAFSLTVMYDIVSNPHIMHLTDGSFDGIMSRIPESASRDSFVASIRENTRNFYTGEAQQRAFAAYFSDENHGVLSAYVEAAISSAQNHALDYTKGGRISDAFQSAASGDVFRNTYYFLQGMPSFSPDDDTILTSREGYLNPWPLSVGDFITAVEPAQFEKMGFKLG